MAGALLGLVAIASLWATGKMPGASGGYQHLAAYVGQEVTSTEQYVMLETAKMLPVGGTAVELLTSATGLMCKFGQADYESLFYDIGTILGGKYLDHLMEPEVFDKLTPKQQTAAKLAKKAYDDLDEYKAEQEREKWLKRPVKTAEPANEPANEPAQNAEAPKDLKDMGKSIEENLGKSVKDLRDALKDNVVE